MKQMLALFTLLAFLVQGCSTPAGNSYTSAANRGVAAASDSWVVSGYLHDKPGKKVYVAIRGDKIESVSESKPRSGTVIETEATIFPGFMDMHNHVKYNILPLWDLAKSQFLNRFEWRTKFPPYKEAVSANMRGVRGDVVCAAVRWAEIKSAAGGATAIQGIGGDSKCAKGFGVNNIEIPDDMGGTKIRSMTDMVMPDLVGSVFVKHIEPHMKKGMSYEKAYEKMLGEQKVSDWVEFFVKEPHSVGNGLKLLIGDDFGLYPRSTSESDFRSAESKIRKYLSGAPYNAKDKQIDKQIESMKKWIFGNRGKDSYLSARKDEKSAYTN